MSSNPVILLPDTYSTNIDIKTSNHCDIHLFQKINCSIMHKKNVQNELSIHNYGIDWIEYCAHIFLKELILYMLS